MVRKRGTIYTNDIEKRQLAQGDHGQVLISRGEAGDGGELIPRHKEGGRPSGGDIIHHKVVHIRTEGGNSESYKHGIWIEVEPGAGRQAGQHNKRAATTLSTPIAK